MEESSNQIFNFMKSKKGQWLLVGILLLVILIASSAIRLQNLPLLVDQTTGENIPLALDPFYFLRIAETLDANNGQLPAIDEMRYPAESPTFLKELHPYAVYYIFKVTKIFNPEITLRYINVISPVIFFALGIIVFFFLILVLTKSKITALVSSLLLSLIPSYLYRTTAGFSDHEASGIIAFFLVLLVLTLGMKSLDKQKNEQNSKRKIYWSSFWGILLGFVTALTIASWGGIANYAFMIVPLAFLLFWVLKTRETEQTSFSQLLNYILFYVLWLVSGIFLSSLFGFSPIEILNRAVFGTQGLLTLFALGFVVVDAFFIYLLSKKRSVCPEIIKKNEKFRVIFVLGIVLILGLIGLQILKGSLITAIQDIINLLLRPAGTGRLSATVAENAAPYLNDWISQAGKFFFWVSLIGIVFIGFNLSKGVESKKSKILFNLLWITLIVGILFSRISASSALDGDNFLSHLVYFGSILIFLAGIMKIYFSSRIKIRPELLVVSSWTLLMLISGRSTIRVLFIMTPFFCFAGAYTLINFYSLFKKNKDELVKIFSIIGIIVIAIMLVISIGRFYSTSSEQAKYTGPSANAQWQQAMKWVRENAGEDSIFLHWWDYGYWVQTLGERKTVADGGHTEGEFQDHLIGRYVLTTPNPNSALSYMKSHKVSHLLIDQTDLGKYGAYSRIGSDETLEDRVSAIPLMSLDPKQTQETSNETINVYVGAMTVDEDIIYTPDNGTQIFLPDNRALVVGVITRTKQDSDSGTLLQPEAVYIYNNKQYRIPVRYIYFQGQIMDFGSGIEATFMIVTSAQPTGQSVSINPVGVGIYLSPMVSKSLFARLYLMDDPFEQYSSLKLVHEENDFVVESLQQQGVIENDQEFVYYQGFRGPIKIWDTAEIPENIIAYEELTDRYSEEWAKFDNWGFIE